MITPTALSVRAGISKGYACDLLAGNKRPSAPMAVRVFRATGVKLGPCADLSDAEIDVLERAHG